MNEDIINQFVQNKNHLRNIECYYMAWQIRAFSDWSFPGRDFAIRTVSVETVMSCVFFAFESRQIQNKLGPSAI